MSRILHKKKKLTLPRIIFTKHLVIDPRIQYGQQGFTTFLAHTCSSLIRHATTISRGHTNDSIIMFP